MEKLVQGADCGCSSEKQRQTVLNCTRLLTRILPYIFEDADWRGFFWSTVPGAGRAGVRSITLTPLWSGLEGWFWRLEAWAAGSLVTWMKGDPPLPEH